MVDVSQAKRRQNRWLLNVLPHLIIIFLGQKLRWIHFIQIAQILWLFFDKTLQICRMNIFYEKRYLKIWFLFK